MKNFFNLTIRLVSIIMLLGLFACEEPTVISPIGRACSIDEQCGAWQGNWVKCVQGTCQLHSALDGQTLDEDSADSVPHTDVDTETSVKCSTSTECDDGNFCNGTEGCSAGLCVKVGIPPCGIGRTANDFCNEDYEECGTCKDREQKWCDDGVEFTIDTCEFMIENSPQCVYEIKAGWCYINQQPYADGDQNPHDACQVCDSESDQLDWTNHPNCPEDSDVVDSDTTNFDIVENDIIELDTGEITEISDPPVDTIEPEDTPDLTEISEPEDTPEPFEVEEPVDAGPDTDEVIVVDLCQEVDCSDENPCTDDECDPKTGFCEYTNNHEPCVDTNPCTTGDMCSEGVCISGPNTCECQTTDDCVTFEDANFCNGTLICLAQVCVIDPETIVFCDPAFNGECFTNSCIPESGECQLIDELDDLTCNDGNTCTENDRCGSGLCTGKQRDCADTNPCTLDSCDAQIGCRYENNPDTCDDGDVCTVGDMCLGGECQPGQNQLECQDNDPCTDDVCFVDIGCDHTPKNCADNNVCTTDACNSEAECTHVPTNCNDGNECTVDTCITMLNIGCASVPQDNPIPCSDDDVCTVDDVCNLQNCVGAPLNCDDDNPCTVETCDPITGCSSTPQNSLCDDGVQCTVDVCDPLVGCIITTDNSVCNDDDVCTTDTCSFTADCQFVFTDIDGDATCDANDFDDDNDEINDDVDNCPAVSNSDQFDDDEDQIGDVCDAQLAGTLMTGSAALSYLPPTLSDLAKIYKCHNVIIRPISQTLVCVIYASPHLFICSQSLDSDGISFQEGDCDDQAANLKLECWPDGKLPPLCQDIGWVSLPPTTP